MTADDNRRQKEQSHDAAVQEKELAEVCAGFADLCHYFSRENMDLPGHIADEIRSVSKLAIADRIPRMKRLNQELMEYLHGVSPSPQIRQ